MRYVGAMQKQFLFEHEGCVLELQSCEHAGKWTAEGTLKFTDSSYEHLRVFTWEHNLTQPSRPSKKRKHGPWQKSSAYFKLIAEQKKMPPASGQKLLLTRPEINPR